MDEDYFDFLVVQLTNWLHDGHFKAGSRYYLALESQAAVDQLFNEIQQTKTMPVKPFIVNNGHSIYQTIALEQDQLKAIIVPLGQRTHTNFLLNLQHLVTRQQAIFKQTMIIYLITEATPNIIYNARDLEDSGGPFALDNILNGLKLANAASPLKAGERAVVSDILHRVLRTKTDQLPQQLAAIYQLYKKDALTATDYVAHQMFYDPELKQTSAATTTKRLLSNQKLFSELKQIIVNNSPEQHIDNYVYFENPKDYQKYQNLANWSDLTYDQITAARQNFLKKTGIKIQLEADKIQRLNQHFTFWLQQKHYADEPTQNHSAKEYSILAFLKPNQISDQVILRLPFNAPLDPDAIDHNQSFFFQGKTDLSDLIKIVNRTIIVNIEHVDPNQIYYGQIHYGSSSEHLPLIFKFAILPFDPKYFLTIAPFFSLDVSNRGYYQIVLHTDAPAITFLGANNQNPVRIPISEQNLQEFFISQTTELDFSELLKQQSKIEFTILTLNIYDHLVPLRFQFSHERIVKQSLSNFAIENLRRQAPNGIYFDQDKLIERNKVYYLNASQQQLLNIETQMIKKQHFYGELNDQGDFEPLPLKLPEDIQASLDQICQFLLDNEMTLSLTTWTKYLKDNVTQLLAQIQQHIDNHLHDIAFPETIRNLFYIGAIKTKHAFYFSPFSPLLLSYRLVYDEMLDDVTLNEKIQTQISPAGLLPYLMMQGSLYQADTSYFNHWIRFTAKQTNHLKANYAHILAEILTNFRRHNTFLFQLNADQPLVVRFAHIYPDRTILKGIIEYFKTADHSPYYEIIPPLELHFQNYPDDQVFEKFFTVKTMTDLENLLGEPVDKTELNPADWQALIQRIQQNLSLYYAAKTITTEQSIYHISFYQPQSQIKLLNQLNQYMKPSFALDGLIPNKQTTMIENIGVQGFGTKDLERPVSNLITFAGIWNTLALICHHQLSPYILHNSWAIRETVVEDKETDKIIASSYQTTLFMPKAELVSKLQDNPKLELNRYHAVEPLAFDVISVTKNTNKVTTWQQYFQHNQVAAAIPQIHNLLHYHNLFNDIWDVNTSDNALKSSLQQITAYKEISGLLYQKDFLWLPISIKILRHYARDFGLDTNDNLLTVNNLSKVGLATDDILLMGLDLKNIAHPVMYLLPIILGPQPFAEANLTTMIEDLGPSFMQDYTKLFLARIFLTSLQQLPKDTIAPTILKKIDSVKDALFRADFEVSHRLHRYYGDAFRFVASTQNAFRTVQRDEVTGNTIVNVPLSDIYTYVLNTPEEIQKLIQSAEFDFQLKDLLQTHLTNETRLTNHHAKKAASDANAAETDGTSPQAALTAGNTTYEPARPLPVKNLSPATMQFYLGKSTTSEMIVNWPYGNTELSDRDLLLFGDDSPTKFKFIQQILRQMTQANLSAVIFLTEDKNRAYFTAQDFPKVKSLSLNQTPIHLDPFAVIRQSINNHYAEATTLALINQLTDMCRPAFNLSGSQVEQINQAMLTGLTKQTATFKFSNLPTYLSDKAILTKLKDLIDQDPFTYQETLKWRHFFDGQGELHVIRCSSFSLPLRKFVLDYLLSGFAAEARNSGSMYHPLPVFIDNAKALNFNMKGPLARTLKQGSQYGISLILNNPEFEPTANDLLMANDFETEILFKMSEEKSLMFAKIMSKSLKEYSNLTKLLTELTDTTYLINSHTLINQQLLPNLTTARLNLK
ncbi:hypothetical protein ACFQ5M_08495 [Agrilactobacillus yilanensis]|uniref:DNA phosphorothioation-dependent restriction protein DptH n=1 Tax=Agrilactobacillus yilanensis TaxID=2485997 RepID=A0ABW4J891_9LACO|nr:hypothetical protein [Agrilactobacillus yilanensis]